MSNALTPISLRNLSKLHQNILRDTGKEPVLLIENKTGDESNKTAGIWELSIILDNDKPTQEVVGSIYATGGNVFCEAYAGDYFQSHHVAKLESRIVEWAKNRHWE